MRLYEVLREKGTWGDEGFCWGLEREGWGVVGFPRLGLRLPEGAGLDIEPAYQQEMVSMWFPHSHADCLWLGRMASSRLA